MDRIINPTDVARAACIPCAILQHRCLHPSDREVIPGIERCRVEVGFGVLLKIARYEVPGSEKKRVLVPERIKIFYSLGFRCSALWADALELSSVSRIASPSAETGMIRIRFERLVAMKSVSDL